MTQKVTALPMGGARSRGPFNDGSGTITAGGSSQQVFDANANRTYLFIQNQSADVLWVNFGIDAVQSQPSIMLVVAAYKEYTIFVPTSSVHIVGATTGQAFCAKEG